LKALLGAAKFSWNIALICIGGSIYPIEEAILCFVGGDVRAEAMVASGLFMGSGTSAPPFCDF
jgi:hypothetical protein